MSSSLQIAACQPEQYRQALALVLRPLPAGQRGTLVEALQRQAEEPLPPYEALVGAWDGANLVGACWVQPQPGRTGALWLPQADSVPIERIATPLIQTAVERADAAGVAMTQSLLESNQDPCEPDLRACGFTRLTELLYLEWSPAGGQSMHTSAASESAGSDSALPDQNSVEFFPASEVPPQRLEAVIAETYIDTLDCPELDGQRSISDVIAGYRETGDHDPQLWFLLRSADKDVGACLLTEHKSSRQIELIYMGVTPAGRGKGIGRAAVAEIRRITSDREADRLLLAVDTRNHPARNIYREAGMTVWANRVVYVRYAP